MSALSFSERMDLGKEVAANKRYKGESTGKPAAGWVRSKKDRFGGMDRTEYALQELEYFYESWRHEWQYMALAAVETALFCPELGHDF